MVRKLIDLFLFIIFGLSVPVLLMALINFFFSAGNPGSKGSIDIIEGLLWFILVLVVDILILKRLNRGGYFDKSNVSACVFFNAPHFVDHYSTWKLKTGDRQLQTKNSIIFNMQPE